MRWFTNLVLCGVASLANAQESPSDYLRLFDANHDGRVSEGEYVERLMRGFDVMDRNQDGVLTRDELPGGRGRPVTRSEYRVRLVAQFHRQDVNHDGFLSAKELAAPPR